MTREDFYFLTSDKIQRLIEENLHRDPVEFALSYSQNDFSVALVSQQLKYLRKAETKLPSWFHARCIIPGLAYEQCSSETTAAMKNFQGQHCLDLTCGLGVDTFSLAKKFVLVTSLEPDPALFEVICHNFQKLKATNISVLNQSAEVFLQNYQGPVFDLVYADPSRRDDSGNRIHNLRDTSPDMVALFPLLKPLARNILIKLSPLFDIAEAYRLFPQASKLWVFSVNNECKELLIEINQSSDFTQPTQVEIGLFRDKYQSNFVFPASENGHLERNTDILPNFIAEPDVAFYKARKVSALFSLYFPQWQGALNYPDGFFLSDTVKGEHFPGRIFEVISAHPYKPRQIQKYLKSLQISRINIVKRHFPQTTKVIRQQLHIQEGGEDFLICTTLKEKNWCFHAKRYKTNEGTAIRSISE
ncbi:MAG: class I SAM-dependent methyltransferase [Bacteroidia bacterium]